MYFGVNSGCRLTAEDYLDVMANLGFSETRARALCSTLVDLSRDMVRAREEERSILV
jgi:hypothetical protein